MACIDSSIGGKTAVNIQYGNAQLKNVIGTFYPPSRVYIDVAAVAALPPRHFSNGMAEITKCAILASPPLFSFLCSSSSSDLQHQPDALARIMYSSLLHPAYAANHLPHARCSVATL
jgi:3-dehydroquinate synthase